MKISDLLRMAAPLPRRVRRAYGPLPAPTPPAGHRDTWEGLTFVYRESSDYSSFVYYLDHKGNHDYRVTEIKTESGKPDPENWVVEKWDGRRWEAQHVKVKNMKGAAQYIKKQIASEGKLP